MLEATIQEFIPHAPQHGLYVEPDIPANKLRAAMGSYGEPLGGERVLALYDATRFGTGKSGALFTATAFCFQNLVETPQRVAYTDLIRVSAKKTLLGGRRLVLVINRARATFEFELDFDARAEALPYVERFLQHAIARSADEEAGQTHDPLEEAISKLEAETDRLSEAQRERLRALGTGKA